MIPPKRVVAVVALTSFVLPSWGRPLAAQQRSAGTSTGVLSRLQEGDGLGWDWLGIGGSRSDAGEPASLPAAEEEPSAPAPKRRIAPEQPAATYRAARPTAGPDRSVAPVRSDEQQLLNVARQLEQRGQSAEAEKMYETVLRDNPRHARANHRLGVLLAKRGALAPAERLLKTALEQLPQHAELLNDVGYCCFLQGRHDEAEAYYRRALEINPNHVTTRNNLTRLLSQRNASEPRVDQVAAARQEAIAAVMASSQEQIATQPAPTSPTSPPAAPQVGEPASAESPLVQVAPAPKAPASGTPAPQHVVVQAPPADSAPAAPAAPAVARSTVGAKVTPIAPPAAEPIVVTKEKPITSRSKKTGSQITWFEPGTSPSHENAASPAPIAKIDAAPASNPSQIGDPAPTAVATSTRLSAAASATALPPASVASSAAETAPTPKRPQQTTSAEAPLVSLAEFHAKGQDELASGPCATPAPEERPLRPMPNPNDRHATASRRVALTAAPARAQPERGEAPDAVQIKALSSAGVQDGAWQETAAPAPSALPRRRSLFSLATTLGGEEPLPSPTPPAVRHAPQNSVATPASSPGAHSANLRAGSPSSQPERAPRRSIWSSLRTLKPFGDE